MTEAEWAVSENPAAMLQSILHERHANETGARRALCAIPSDRKLRLFACAVVRQVWDGAVCPRCDGDGEYCRTVPILGWVEGMPATCHGSGRTGGLTDPRSRRAVEVAESFADGLATEWQREAARVEAFLAFEVSHHDFAAELAWRCVSHVNALTENSGLPRWFSVSTKLADQQAALLRCIAGNPWRPVKLRPLNASVDMVNRCLEIARSIYDERRWGDLGILADALIEAGCPETVECWRCKGKGYFQHGMGEYKGRLLSDPDCSGCGATGRVPSSLLVHLRRSGPHARGCHVLDAILGRD